MTPAIGRMASAATMHVKINFLTANSSLEGLLENFGTGQGFQSRPGKFANSEDGVVGTDQALLEARASRHGRTPTANGNRRPNNARTNTSTAWSKEVSCESAFITRPISNFCSPCPGELFVAGRLLAPGERYVARSWWAKRCGVDDAGD